MMKPKSVCFVTFQVLIEKTINEMEINFKKKTGLVAQRKEEGR